MTFRLLICCGFAALCGAVLKPGRADSEKQARPNIIFILTDDQDEALQSMEAMPKVKRLISDRGVRFPNMFVATPICCPSRSTIVTGRYGHNNGATNNSISGHCSSPYWQQTQETRTFPILLRESGYTTFFAGKYLNKYGYPGAGGPEHVPPGWDWWAGLIGQSYYYNYSLSVNGTRVWHGSHLEDYLTTVIEEKAMEFLRYAAPHQPFFMMLCPTAAHAPFLPLPQYDTNFTDLKAPRTPSYNHHADDKHWLIRHAPEKISQSVLDHVDGIFRNRWRTLQSVDQMVEDLMRNLKQQGLLENTVFIYSSDNGFHLGQFCFPWDKRLPYEFDIRVPLAVMGPSIVQGKVRYEPISTVDLAPTILTLAGVKLPSWLDGSSMTPLLKPDLLTRSNRRRVRHQPNNGWREYFLVEYWGMDHGGLPKDCPYKEGEGVADCDLPECICQDAWNNTYSCMRHLRLNRQGNAAAKDEIYCEFRDNDHFAEYYDLKADPYQMQNQAARLSPVKRTHFRTLLKQLKGCRGRTCQTVGIPMKPPKWRRHRRLKTKVFTETVHDPRRGGSHVGSPAKRDIRDQMVNC